MREEEGDEARDPDQRHPRNKPCKETVIRGEPQLRVRVRSRPSSPSDKEVDGEQLRQCLWTDVVVPEGQWGWVRSRPASPLILDEEVGGEQLRRHLTLKSSPTLRGQ